MTISEINDTITLSLDDTAGEMRKRADESTSAARRAARQHAIHLLNDLVMPAVREAANERLEGVMIRIVPTAHGVPSGHMTSATFDEIMGALNRAGYVACTSGDRSGKETTVHVTWAHQSKVGTGP